MKEAGFRLPAKHMIARLILGALAVMGISGQQTDAQTCSNWQRVASIQRVGDNQIRLAWQSLPSATYYVQAFTNLNPFALFSTLATVSSQGSQTIYTDSPPANLTARFYRVLDASNPSPCVSIVSPTNGATVSGLLNIGFYATAFQKITSVTLIVDGQSKWTMTEGGNLPFPSYFFSNGVHTITVQVADDGINQGQGIATSSINLNVQNNINLTWYEAFGSILPIQAQLAYQNASYTIQIKDESENLVKTILGSTANGTINTNWDGTNSSGNQVPDDAAYFIVLSATPSGGALATSSTDTITASAFREKSFGTEYTILARQKLSIPTWESVSVGKLSSIKSSIGLAEHHPEIYNSAVLVMANPSDWQGLLSAFKASPTRNTQFYFTGDASGTAIGQGPGLQTFDVKLSLNNRYFISPRYGVPVAHFSWPYKFVFLDGCLSGTGDWMQAFGILNNTMNYSTVDRKNRAFIGWSDIQVEWLFNLNNGYTKFATEFWDAWTTDDTRPLQNAVQLALSQASDVDPNKLVIRGYNQLQWSD
jgi:hypothetical protein